MAANPKAVGEALMTKRHDAKLDIAPVEPIVVVGAKRRPSSSSFQGAWGAIAALAGTSILSVIAAPWIGSVTPSDASGQAPTDGTLADGTTAVALPSPQYVYLAPGAVAPQGAPVVRLDPITVMRSPAPGSATVPSVAKRKVIYIYLKPGQTPPPGAIVRTAGSITAPASSGASTGSTSGGTSSKGGSSTGGTTTPPVATPAPTLPPVAPPPPVTKPSGKP
jgi:hypothetical protein